VRQSGLPEVRIADLWKDRDLLEAARDMAGELLTKGPESRLDTGHRALYSYLREAAQARRVMLGGG
jgi:RecG-like helicase